MLSAQLIGILAGLASAFIWGSGDFAGGLAARQGRHFQVVTLSALAGLVLLIPAALLRGETLPSPASLAWSWAAGFSGAAGIAALYRALSTGSAAVVAPTAGVVGATVPVIVGSWLEGLPGGTQSAGILAGLAGIWLVSRPASPEGASGRSELTLAVLAGIGFGGFFVCIAQVEAGLLFGPLAVAKLAALAFGAAILALQRQPVPSPASNPLALLAGVFEVGGNLFYLIAVRYIPLSVAAVLASMYPASTVLLAMIVLRERVRGWQALGVILCLVAVVLVTV